MAASIVADLTRNSVSKIPVLQYSYFVLSGNAPMPPNSDPKSEKEKDSPKAN